MSISLDIDGDVARITLDDGRANAIDPDWLDTFLDTFTEAEKGAKAIVIAGREGIFSGGFNLKWMPTATAEQMAGLICRVYGSPRPIVAACTGHAIAMGFFVLLACDTRVGPTGDFKFGANETMNGMNLPVFGTEIAKARLEETSLTKLIIQSYMFGPEEAVEFGALDALVATDKVVDSAHAIAAQLAQLPAGAYGANKLALRQPVIDRIKVTKAGY